jgi:hypothetical protein
MATLETKTHADSYAGRNFQQQDVPPARWASARLKLVVGFSVVALLPVGCRHSPSKPSAGVTEAEYHVLSVYMARQVYQQCWAQ